MFRICHHLNCLGLKLPNVGGVLQRFFSPPYDKSLQTTLRCKDYALSNPLLVFYKQNHSNNVTSLKILGSTKNSEFPQARLVKIKILHINFLDFSTF